MTESPTEPDVPDSHDAGTPRWVKVFGIVGIALILLFVISLVIGGGEHGPGRHASPSALAEHSAPQR